MEKSYNLTMPIITAVLPKKLYRDSWNDLSTEDPFSKYDQADNESADKLLVVNPAPYHHVWWYYKLVNIARRQK